MSQCKHGTTETTEKVCRVCSEAQLTVLDNHLAYMVNNLGEPNCLETRERFAVAKAAVSPGALAAPDNQRIR
jgi:hypothetical protein